MKTKDEVLKAVELQATWERGSNEMLGSRDYSRLKNFFPVEKLETFGFKIKKDADVSKWVIRDWTEEAILSQLEHDLDFAFEKAIDERGISSSLMHEVILMWLWVLDDELAITACNDYDPYGLPLYKRVAEKYAMKDRSTEHFN